MNFQFATSRRIIFGPGKLSESGALARELGQRALVVTGRTPSRAEPLLDRLAAHDIPAVVYTTPPEPTTIIAQEGAAQAQDAGCDLVISFGGGSAIDTAKAIAALMTNDGALLDYLEVIGQGKALDHPAAPHIAIPTTAGTGSEVTRNAVLASPEHRVKVSLRSAGMIPTVALIDPLLTHSVPPEVTAYTGLDALAQVIEPYVSRRANPLTDAICREGIRRAAGALRRAYHEPDNAAARENMALVSLFGGLALANAGLGAAHGFAGPFGGMFDAPHGAVVAALLPYVMAVNVQVLQAREPDSPVLHRYDDVGRLLTGNAAAKASDAVDWIAALCDELALPALGAYGLTAGHFATLIDKAQQSSSMKGNPIALSDDELRRILQQAL